MKMIYFILIKITMLFLFFIERINIITFKHGLEILTIKWGNKLSRFRLFAIVNDGAVKGVYLASFYTDKGERALLALEQTDWEGRNISILYLSFNIK